MDFIQYLAGIITSGKLLALSAAPAWTFNQVPDIEIKSVIRTPGDELFSSGRLTLISSTGGFDIFWIISKTGSHKNLLPPSSRLFVSLGHDLYHGIVFKAKGKKERIRHNHTAPQNEALTGLI